MYLSLVSLCTGRLSDDVSRLGILLITWRSERRNGICGERKDVE